MSTDWTQNTTALKILIAVMTTLLVAGLILLVVGMARTAGELTDGMAAVEVDVSIPSGHQVVASSLSDDRLALHLAPPGGEVALILIVALENGKVLRRIHVGPER